MSLSRQANITEKSGNIITENLPLHMNGNEVQRIISINTSAVFLSRKPRVSSILKPIVFANVNGKFSVNYAPQVMHFPKRIDRFIVKNAP